jgi:glycosyltransferase involved in cell wall biosynthesis
MTPPAYLVPSCSIVVPVYNAELNLSALVDQLAGVLPDLSPEYEAILVNDGSRDTSWAIIEQLTGRYDWVRGINLMRNYGQHNALLCGIRAARCEVIVTLDDDLQHPPSEIAPLLAKLAEGYDVVYGAPHDEQHGLWRDLASQITKLALQAAMGADTARHVSAFRAFRSQVRDAFSHFHNPYVSIDVLLTWGTGRFTSLRVRHAPRRAGTSNYTVRKLVAHGINMVTGFSTWPLRLASLTGFGFTLFGIAILVYVIGRYVIEGGSVPGFPFLASVIALFSGAQLFALGILGEYLARTHASLMERPAYIIREPSRLPQGMPPP